MLVQSLDKRNPKNLNTLLEITDALKKEWSYSELRLLGKYIYKLLDAPDIPNHLWIKGHIVCAKILIKNPKRQNYSEAIKMLKEPALLLPNLPISGTIYNIKQNLDLYDFPALTSNNNIANQMGTNDSLFCLALDAESDSMSPLAPVRITKQGIQKFLEKT